MKKREGTIKGVFTKLYIDMYSMNQAETLTKSAKRYIHKNWDEDLESVELLPSLRKEQREKNDEFKQGFAVMLARKKFNYVPEVVEFVREKFEEGETTKRPMPYPKIVQDIENAKKSDGTPRFLPNTWPNKDQVSYLVKKFMKEKASKIVTEEENKEKSDDDILQHNADVLQQVRDQLLTYKPLKEQDHPLLLEDETNICDIARDYQNNSDGKASELMQMNFDDEIAPILEAIGGAEFQGKIKRKAATQIVNFVKENCGCIPKRRSKKSAQ